jgi:hypothetical protein
MKTQNTQVALTLIALAAMTTLGCTNSGKGPISSGKSPGDMNVQTSPSGQVSIDTPTEEEIAGETTPAEQHAAIVAQCPDDKKHLFGQPTKAGHRLTLRIDRIAWNEGALRELTQVADLSVASVEGDPVNPVTMGRLQMALRQDGKDTLLTQDVKESLNEVYLKIATALPWFSKCHIENESTEAMTNVDPVSFTLAGGQKLRGYLSTTKYKGSEYKCSDSAGVSKKIADEVEVEIMRLDVKGFLNQDNTAATKCFSRVPAVQATKIRDLTTGKVLDYSKSEILSLQ